MNLTIDDIPKTTSAMPTITIYGPHECPNCDQLMKNFDRAEVPYTKVDIEPGDENYQHVTQDLGYREAPVVIVEFADHRTVHWGGRRLDMPTKIKRLVTRGVQSA